MRPVRSEMPKAKFDGYHDIVIIIMAPISVLRNFKGNTSIADDLYEPPWYSKNADLAGTD